jgi:pimeloyl-[acyl-carrier protein] methyl ester esterase
MTTLDREDGVRLHVEVAGTGPALLVVHGWSRSSADVAALAACLPGRRVLAPDLRGHGRSSAGPFTLAALAADLAALAEAEALEGALLLGWSLGAQVALAALAAHPALRRRVAGLVLLGATPRFTEGDGWPHGLPARALEGLALRVRRSPGRALGRFLEDCFAPGELGEAARAGLARRPAAPAPDQAALLAGLDLLATADLRGDLGAADLPALVLHGEADAICPVGAGRALAAALPRARLLTFPGLGHAPLLSRPALLAAAIGAFALEL